MKKARQIIQQTKPSPLFKNKKALILILILILVTFALFGLSYYTSGAIDVEEWAFIVLVICMFTRWKIFFTVLVFNNLLNLSSLIYYHYLLTAGYYSPGEMDFAVDAAGIFFALFFLAIINCISLLFYLIQRKPTGISQVITIALLILTGVSIFYLFYGSNNLLS